MTNDKMGVYSIGKWMWIKVSDARGYSEMDVDRICGLRELKKPVAAGDVCS